MNFGLNMQSPIALASLGFVVESTDFASVIEKAIRSSWHCVQLD